MGQRASTAPSAPVPNALLEWVELSPGTLPGVQKPWIDFHHSHWVHLTDGI